MQVGIRTKDRWPQLACLLSRLVGEPIDRLILADQSVTLPPPHVTALLSLFREVLHLHLPPGSVQRELFAKAGSEGILVQLDDDVLPIRSGFTLHMAYRLEKEPDLAFVIGCTKEVGHPAPPDNLDEGFPNYLRWSSFSRGDFLSLRPCGIAFCFTGIQLSVVPKLEAWLENVAWKDSVLRQVTRSDDTFYGIAAESLGYRAEVLPGVFGYHIQSEGGDDPIVSGGRALCDLLFEDSARSGMIGQGNRVVLPDHVLEALGVKVGDAVFFHHTSGKIEVLNVEQYEEVLRPE